MIDGCGERLTDANGKSVDVATLSCIFPLIANVISWLLEFAGVVAVIMIIYSGIRFMFSGGDPKQIEGAKKTLLYAVLGLVLIFLSFAIIRFISQVTGVSCIDPARPLSFGACSRTSGGGFW